jgi:3-deoxy-manno-octulosonate cytidylyltransferase (CMP-KDO synthetase)
MTKLGASVPFRVVIPARFASSRLPGKPLLPIGGKPMIQHVVENAREAGATAVVVATDDQRITDAVRQFGGEVAMTSAEHVSGTDRIAELARKEGWDPGSIVVNLQGDEPLLAASAVRRVANLLASRPDAGMATLAAPINDVDTLFNPNVVKVVTTLDGRALYFSRAPIPWQRDEWLTLQERPAGLPGGTQFLRHIGLYAYRVETLLGITSATKDAVETAESLEQLRALRLGIGILVDVVDEVPEHGVDTPDDLRRVEAWLAQRSRATRARGAAQE